MDNIIAAGLSLGQATESQLRTAQQQGCTPVCSLRSAAQRPGP